MTVSQTSRGQSRSRGNANHGNAPEWSATKRGHCGDTFRPLAGYLVAEAGQGAMPAVGLQKDSVRKRNLT